MLKESPGIIQEKIRWLTCIDVLVRITVAFSVLPFRQEVMETGVPTRLADADATAPSNDRQRAARRARRAAFWTAEFLAAVEPNARSDEMFMVFVFSFEVDVCFASEFEALSPEPV